MKKHTRWMRLAVVVAALGALPWAGSVARAESPATAKAEEVAAVRDGQRGAMQREMMRQKRLRAAEQRAAAKRLAAKRAALMAKGAAGKPVGKAFPGCPTCGEQGGIPDYFGTTPNWAFSPLPKGVLDATSVAVTDGGSMYAAPPAVVIDDLYGHGAGATAEATVAGGVVTAVTITNVGADYVAPVITIAAPTDPLGTAAMAEVALDPLTLSGGLRKFVDTLPGLNASNNLGQQIPVATPDTVTYPGSDYYELELHQYTEQMHQDLKNPDGSPARTTLRGYAQVNLGTNAYSAANPSGCGAPNPACTLADNTVVPPRDGAGNPLPHYLGPLIVGQKDRPIRIKFSNKLATGIDGNLYIPVDTTVMGSGLGPDLNTNYSQNRAALHLHGGRTPWISDGTAHQWFTPAGEPTGGADARFKKGASFQNVPDMPDPGDGSMTVYWTNQQSSRLLFYHDHSSGITRLNVYVGEAAGYLLQDQTEAGLVAAGLIPATQIPLVLQNKTFVDPNTILKTDPTWNWGTGPSNGTTRTPQAGDLWWPHVYMTAENPFDMTGANATGRWVYGPWFWPPTPVCSAQNPPPRCIMQGVVPNIWYQPDCERPVTDPLYIANCTRPWEPPEMPGTPYPSWGAEAFLDTPMVNGTAYPTLTLPAQPYRLRVLNADHDRFVNLGLYVAVDPGADRRMGTADDKVCDATGGGVNCTEVKMVPAATGTCYACLPPYNGGPLPANWPADGRAGGVPDPALKGPDWHVIGSEGGFLPAPVTVPVQPLAWNLDPTMFNVGNVQSFSLALGPAERSDVIVDLTAYAGKTLILYNDAPAPWPALDPHYDYYTGVVDNTGIGGAPVVYPGWGPNTRTVMQIKVGAAGAGTFDPAALANAFVHTPTTPGVFESGQDDVIVGQSAYNSAYGVTFPSRWPYWGIARISDAALGFQTVQEAQAGTWPPANRSFAMAPKAIHDEMGGVFDEYGRLSAKLGIEIFGANAQTQNFAMQAFIDPTTEIVQPSQVGSQIGALGDGTQIWKITHNGVDTHPIHFHLFDVQLINRVGWDGFIRLPDPTEFGWKETVRVSPLEDTIVALRPVLPRVPFGLPVSERLMNPARPQGDTEGFTNIDPTTGQPLAVPTTNQLAFFGWEYTWHCHILSHEENDMMRPIAFNVGSVLPAAPNPLTATVSAPAGAPQVTLTWADGTPFDYVTGLPAGTLGDPADEIGYRIERAIGAAGVFEPLPTTAPLPTVGLANTTSYVDPTVGADPVYRYRVVAFNAAGEVASDIVTLSMHMLTVGKTGSGAGTLTSDPAGVNCGGDCVGNYADGTAVTLTANPATGSTFDGWSGACTGTGPCSVTMDADKAVDATFTLIPYTLTVTLPANGTITSADGFINCGTGGSACAKVYDYGTSVSLTATPNIGYDLSTWTGACAGTGGCALTINADKTVGAAFSIQRFTLTVTPPTNGTITSADGFITCGSGGPACASTYDYGTVVALTATPATGYNFAAWSGACAGSGACSVTIDAAKAVGATFTPIPYTLTVTQPANGTITSADGFINCGTGGSLCARIYDYPTVVSLSAIPDAGYTFATWTGACIGAGACSVTMDADKTIDAGFSPIPYTLTVAPPANGTITSADGFISCGTGGSACTRIYDYPTLVSLTATPDAGYLLTAWAGACTGTGACAVTMDADKTLGASFALQPVVWTNLVGVAATGNDLTKTASAGWGNGGATSTQQLPSGDGFVEITVSETTTYRMFGLSNGNTSADYPDIDYALYLRGSGDLLIFEGGAYRGVVGTYNSGDKLRIAVEGGAVKYRKNGVLLYSSLVAPSYPLLVDTALYSQNATITSAVVSNWPAALSISDAGVLEGDSGTTPMTFTVSLSVASAATVTVNWATSDGTAVAGQDYVAGSGTLTFNPGETSLPVSVTVNGDTTYEPGETFTVTLSSPSGAILGDAQGIGTITNDEAPPVTTPVVWTNLVGVTATGNDLIKTASPGWGNGGATSTQQLPSGDGFVEVTVSETTTYRMFGLSKGNTSADYPDIDYALYLRGSGDLLIFEGGAYRGVVGTYNSGDKLRIAVEGGAVKYRKNGVLLFGSLVAPSYPLLVDTALYSQNATITSAVVSNWP